MIAVDTSALLRSLLHDDEAQAARVGAAFDTAETVLITDVVLVETVWTLSGRKYRLAKAELVAVLERLFSEPNIRFEDDQCGEVRPTTLTDRDSLAYGVFSGGRF